MIKSSEAKNQTINAIIVSVKKEKYLLEVKDVKEIYIPGDKVISVPLADRTIVGIIDIRGIIYSIISLRVKINPDEKNIGFNENSRLLLLESDGLEIALMVDSVIGVKQLPLSIFEEKSTIIETSIDYQYIKAIGVEGEDSYILLDLEALIPEELYNISSKPILKKKDIRMNLRQQEVIRNDQQNTIQLPELSVFESATKIKTPQVKKRRDLLLENIELTKEQRDLLQEVGNIGSGNAITALSRLIKKKIDVNLTDVGIISFNELTQQFGGPAKQICGIFSNIKGQSQSTILQVFDSKPLLQIVANLAGKNTKINPEKVKSESDLDDFAISTIKEIGNIMAGHYASGISDLIGSKLLIDTPEFTMSSAGNLEEFLENELSALSKYIILIKTSLEIVDLKLNGIFFFIPDLQILKTIFSKLKINFQEPTTKDRYMDISNIKLTERQRDSLQEVGNMGAGNAANALAKMINKRVDIDIPMVEMVELDNYADVISKKGDQLLIAWSNIKGKTRATILTIFNIKDIINLTSIIIDDDKKKQIDLRKKLRNVDDFPLIYKDAIMELCHILGSNYTNAIGDLLEIRLMTDPPDMSIDTGKQLFSILHEEIGLLKALSLVITTNVIISDIKITGTFLFIPELGTLKDLLELLNSFYE
ncbi:MAG: chemotaxis protein CheC [Promethearchaeota archaeon]